jgi:hypothetical protein
VRFLVVEKMGYLQTTMRNSINIEGTQNVCGIDDVSPSLVIFRTIRNKPRWSLRASFAVAYDSGEGRECIIATDRHGSTHTSRDRSDRGVGEGANTARDTSKTR